MKELQINRSCILQLMIFHVLIIIIVITSEWPVILYVRFTCIIYAKTLSLTAPLLVMSRKLLCNWEKCKVAICAHIAHNNKSLARFGTGWCLAWTKFTVELSLIFGNVYVLLLHWGPLPVTWVEDNEGWPALFALYSLHFLFAHFSLSISKITSQSRDSIVLKWWASMRPVF